MPTGYTSDLYEGNDISFEDFVLKCARAFGALVMMRDDPMDADIPEEFSPNLKYADQSIKEYRAALDEALNWTDEEAQAAADKHVRDAREKWTETYEKNNEIKHRYETMLEKVRNWEPPTSKHENLKKFMIEQLEDSIRFDCRMDYWPWPKDKDGEEYRQERVAYNTRMLNSAVERRNEEIQRAKERTAWVKALRESLE